MISDYGVMYFYIWGSFLGDSYICCFLNSKLTNKVSDQKSANICRDPPRSNQINQTIAKHKPPNANAQTNDENAEPLN